MKRLGAMLFWLGLGAGLIWSALAVSVQLSGSGRLIIWGALILAAIGVVTVRRRTRLGGWGAMALAGCVIAAWYSTIQPRQDRDWAPDVSRGVLVTQQGDMVTLDNIRDFRWKTPDEAQQNWISRSYDLTELESIDMITSVWASPAIAHLLVSFGFRNGDHVVFSAEIRRERGEAFNEIGGFFRQFELVLIAATEDDIVRLRSQVRGETVSLYRVDLASAARRDMFLAYAELAQELQRKPAFYNTLSANCTTVVWRLAHSLRPDLPFGPGLILSGYLPEYISGLGLLGGQGTLAQKRAGARIDPKRVADLMEQGLPYSMAIRDNRTPR